MLNWPEEIISPSPQSKRWWQPYSNICLDFHGDPIQAKLVIFSDGNHHMALSQALQEFAKKHPEVESVFYATTPPGPLVSALKQGSLIMGNLVLSIRPHVFISPPEILENLVSEGFIKEMIPFVRNQGNVLLVSKDNPKHISGVKDLLQENVRLFLSNPEYEKSSYSTYLQTIKNLAINEGLSDDIAQTLSDQDKIVYSQRIHHREAPEAIAQGLADAAMVYYHLALRYKRIFPDYFDLVPLGGNIDTPSPISGNIISNTYMGLIDQGGRWGKELLSFFQSRTVQDIYLYHGLIPL